MKLRHVVESQQFTVPLLMDLFNRAKGMERVVARGGTREYEGRILASLFYEPSTRTRFSFESAMLRLGGGVLSTEQARIFSSAVEGEEVEDSIRTLAGYCDVIVIRHHQTGGAARAARVSPVPLVNAGEAGGQHPTQALLDLYTIYRRRSLDGLAVAFVGELDRGRTARSLAYLLAKFERVKIWFVSPPEMQMQPDILQYLERHGVAYELADDVHRVAGEVDVVYQTRIQPDRAAGLRVPGNRYTIDAAVVARMRPDAMILHPLPRTVELDKSVDDDPRALYFQQATNGLYVRMALLTLLLDGE
jgi:aspartate carbamoyltransferase catalytic subunit